MSVFKKEMSPRQRQKAQRKQAKKYFRDKGKKGCFGCLIQVLIYIFILLEIILNI